MKIIPEKYVVLKDEGAVSELNVIEQKNKIINLKIIYFLTRVD